MGEKSVRRDQNGGLMIKVFIEYKDGPSMTRLCSSWDVARKGVRAAIDRGEAISACLREVGKGEIL